MTALLHPPLISFVLVGYNQERFVREAVAGALAQTYSPLEVVLSDDCSPDRTFDIMREMAENYRGPHAVRLNRNERNLGIGGHINRCMELARGELIVGAAADDISLPHRVVAIVDSWLASDRRAYSLFSACKLIDEEGRELGQHDAPSPPVEWDLLKLCRKLKVGVTGASHCWHRSTFDRFGPLNNDIAYEDQVIPLRSRLLGDVVYLPEPLVRYRRATGAVTIPKQQGSTASNLRRLHRLHADQMMAVYRQWQSDFQKTSSAPAGWERTLEALMARARFNRTMQEKGFFARLASALSALRYSVNLTHVVRNYPLFASWHGYNAWARLTWKGNMWEEMLSQARAKKQK